MANPALDPVTEAFVLTYGWFYWGFFFSAVAYGVTLVQTWLYANDNEDGWPMRTFVVLIVALDTAATLLTAMTGQHYFLDNFGNVVVLLAMPTTLSLESTVTVVITFLAQVFFMHQLYIVNRKALPLIIVAFVFSLTSLVLGIVFTVSIFTDVSIQSQSHGILYYSIGLGQIADFAADMLVTIGLCCSLWNARSGLQRTDTLLRKLITYFLNRGLLVTACQLLFAVLYLAGPLERTWIFFHLLLSKFYTNTLLAILNARGGLRAHVDHDSADHGAASTFISFVPLGAMPPSDGAPTTSEGSTYAPDAQLKRSGSEKRSVRQSYPPNYDHSIGFGYGGDNRV